MSQDAEVKMTDDKCCILHNFAHVVSHILFMHTFLNNAEYTISGLCWKTDGSILFSGSGDQMQSTQAFSAIYWWNFSTDGSHLWFNKWEWKCWRVERRGGRQAQQPTTDLQHIQINIKMWMETDKKGVWTNQIRFDKIYLQLQTSTNEHFNFSGQLTVSKMFPVGC